MTQLVAGMEKEETIGRPNYIVLLRQNFLVLPLAVPLDASVMLLTV
jgi:hypothetical protein